MKVSEFNKLSPKFKTAIYDAVEELIDFTELVQTVMDALGEDNGSNENRSALIRDIALEVAVDVRKAALGVLK